MKKRLNTYNSRISRTDRTKLFEYLISEKVPDVPARIISNTNKAYGFDREDLVCIYKELTSHFDIPEKSAAVLASSHGIFRDTWWGRLKVSYRYATLKRRLIKTLKKKTEYSNYNYRQLDEFVDNFHSEWLARKSVF